MKSHSSLGYDYPLQPWLVCFSASFLFFFIFMQLNMFNAINPGLIKDFGITAAQLGNLSANYFYANVIFLFPAGIILDRISTRKIILLSMLVSVVCTFGFAAATELWQAEICRFVTGVAGSFCLLSNVRLASRWFEAHRMALIIGLIVTLAMVGGVIAQTPLTLLVDHLGWRSTLNFDGLFGILIFMVMYIFIRDYPPHYHGLFQEQQLLLHQFGFWRSLWKTLKNPQNWLGGIYTSLMNLPLVLLGALWGSLYLIQVRGLDRASASVVISMLFLGTIVGSPSIGWLSDQLRRRRLPMIVGSVCALGLSLLLMYMPSLSITSLIFIFFGLGLVTSTQILSYPLIAESNPLALTGSAEGLASVLIMAGGMTQPLFARLMEWRWAHQYVNDLPLFSEANYRTAFVIMPFAFIIAFAASCLLRETRCTPFSELKEKHE